MSYSVLMLISSKESVRLSKMYTRARLTCSYHYCRRPQRGSVGSQTESAKHANGLRFQVTMLLVENKSVEGCLISKLGQELKQPDIGMVRCCSRRRSGAHLSKTLRSAWLRRARQACLDRWPRSIVDKGRSWDRARLQSVCATKASFLDLASFCLKGVILSAAACGL